MSDAATSTGRLVRAFRRGPWETAAMVLIAAGIVMLVQPWSIDLYGYSFVTILVGTLGYVAVSHFPE
jgi:drug/metabolite transporter (DMT)-like permease